MGCLSAPTRLMVLTDVLKGLRHKAGRVMCGVPMSPHLNGPASLRAPRLQWSEVKTLALGGGETFPAVLVRFGIVIKIVHDYVAKSVRMLCI